MKDLSEYLVGLALSLFLIAVTYSVYSEFLVEIIETAFEPIRK